MKKLFILLSFLFMVSSLQSQVLITLLLGDKLNSEGLEFGLEGGVNWTNISGMETSDLGRKWNLGFYFDIRLRDQWFLYTGVLVKANMGVDKLTENDLAFLNIIIDEEEGDYSQKISSFLVPALAKYKFKNHMYVEAGPQFGLMYKSWVEFESDIDDRYTMIKEYNKEMINKLDVGIMFGTGYTFRKGPGWSVGAKYYYGFVDVYKARTGTKNSSIFLKLNIPIGAGEKTKEQKGS